MKIALYKIQYMYFDKFLVRDVFMGSTSERMTTLLMNRGYHQLYKWHRMVTIISCVVILFKAEPGRKNITKQQEGHQKQLSCETALRLLLYTDRKPHQARTLLKHYV